MQSSEGNQMFLHAPLIKEEFLEEKARKWK